MVPVNDAAILVSAIVTMILGALWFGPVFGSEWQRLMGFSEERMAAFRTKGLANLYVIQALGALVMSYVLEHAIVFAGSYLMINGIPAGLMIGFSCWFGFIAPVTIGSVLWEGKPLKLWYISSGYYLVSFLLMGMILAVWK